MIKCSWKNVQSCWHNNNVESYTFREKTFDPSCVFYFCHVILFYWPLEHRVIWLWLVGCVHWWLSPSPMSGCLTGPWPDQRLPSVLDIPDTMSLDTADTADTADTTQTSCDHDGQRGRQRSRRVSVLFIVESTGPKYWPKPRPSLKTPRNQFFGLGLTNNNMGSSKKVLIVTKS